MSRRGNCYDNAPVESFFATLKAECVRGIVYPSRALARAELFEYIEIFYNVAGRPLRVLPETPFSTGVSHSR